MDDIDKLWSEYRKESAPTVSFLSFVAHYKLKQSINTELEWNLNLTIL